VFGDLSKEAISEMFNSMKEGLQDMTDPAEEAAETIGDILAPAVQSMSLTFTNDFVNSLLEGENALSSFKDFSKNIVSQIISTFLQLAVVNQILNKVFGGNIFPTLSFGDKGMQYNAPRASGGAMSRGKSYLVGERGPELFIPQVAGTLKNGNDTRSMMGGGAPIVVNQSLNFSTGVVPTVRAEVQRMLPQISEVTKSSVLEATRRGGN
jgi:phage-related minor tail protein